MTEKFYTSLILMILNLFFAYINHRNKSYKFSGFSLFVAGLCFAKIIMEVQEKFYNV